MNYPTISATSRKKERKTKLAEPANRHAFSDHANQTEDITQKNLHRIKSSEKTKLG
jgi:hypothetical protein